MEKVRNLILNRYIFYCKKAKTQRKQIYRIPIAVITAVTFNVVLYLITPQL